MLLTTSSVGAPSRAPTAPYYLLLTAGTRGRTEQGWKRTSPAGPRGSAEGARRSCRTAEPTSAACSSWGWEMPGFLFVSLFLKGSFQKCLTVLVTWS